MSEDKVQEKWDKFINRLIESSPRGDWGGWSDEAEKIGPSDGSSAAMRELKHIIQEIHKEYMSFNNGVERGGIEFNVELLRNALTTAWDEYQREQEAAAMDTPGFRD